MGNGRIPALCGVLFLCLSSALPAGPPKPEEKDSWVTAIARESAADIGNMLGLPLEGEIAVYMCGTDAEIEAAVGGRQPCWALAMASPRQRIIAVDRRKLQIATANDINVAIRHEMVHIILGQVPGRFPRWFEEGTAEVLSGRFIDTASPELRTAARRGGLIPFNRLTHDWPGDAAGARLAYAEATSAVSYLLSAYGGDSVRRIVLGMTRRVSFERSFRTTTGVDPAAFEREWAGSLAGGFRLWFLLLLARPPYIFAAMAALMVVAAAAYLVRRKRTLRRLEEEEYWI